MTQGEIIILKASVYNSHVIRNISYSISKNASTMPTKDMFKTNLILNVTDMKKSVCVCVYERQTARHAYMCTFDRYRKK